MSAREATDTRSGFHIDQNTPTTAVGAVPTRVDDAGSAVETAVRACATATRFSMPLHWSFDQRPWTFAR
ncbi:hypothetical protein OG339_44730 [Streptosporangium sp. NBC_01495]|uniref:hypothetical protein n=1 Tax=Streptosporangium sp. NBC_01495 TaxID=2903899 RepID=UPI002E330126|nr:hypothetical protein [Streptosporangium sp. NBC_01495]